jgi:hypothetical protein
MKMDKDKLSEGNEKLLYEIKKYNEKKYKLQAEIKYFKAKIQDLSNLSYYGMTKSEIKKEKLKRIFIEKR